MSHVNALFHIVFCTKNRRMTLTNEYRNDIYRFILNLTKEQKSKLIRIGGIPNHIHMLVDLNPTIALSDFMRSIKAKSSGWISTDGRFPSFEGWAHEYFAASVSYNARNEVIEYIKGQQEHHRGVDFREEIQRMLEEVGMKMYEGDYL